MGLHYSSYFLWWVSVGGGHKKSTFKKEKKLKTLQRQDMRIQGWEDHTKMKIEFSQMANGV